MLWNSISNIFDIEFHNIKSNDIDLGRDINLQMISPLEMISPLKPRRPEQMWLLYYVRHVRDENTHIHTYNSPYLGGKGQPGFFFRHFFNGVKIGGAFFPDLAHFICHIRKYCVISKMHCNYSLLALFFMYG